MSVVIVTGTDTGIGKTVFAAGLTAALSATYWKPVQSGLEEETDSQIVARLSGRPVLPEAWRLDLPASPHLSAEAEGVEIDAAALTLPDVTGPLVIEGAGGLMVPLNRRTLYVDVIAGWGAPVILCARTALGTINHTLLSLEALRARGCPVLGVALQGDAAPEVEQTICDFGAVPSLGRLPRLDPLTPAALGAAFAAIDMDRIRKALTT
ncbi:MAG: ATP-dependent dethiobiotin synthetase BioD [Rhodobacteraceae bacterium]|nr:ATP-dependent dethiobiotin synthetase BioD [Paracoccaceae bacterium]